MGIESKTKPGQFYYFNSKSGQNEVRPPRVSLPWKLLESKTKKGQFYYFNEETGQNSVDPPPGARPAAQKRPNESVASGDAKRLNGRVPAGWTRKESDTHKGKFYFVNNKTGETSWTQPSVWEKKESKSNPGSFYYINKITGESSWDNRNGA